MDHISIGQRLDRLNPGGFLTRIQYDINDCISIKEMYWSLPKMFYFSNQLFVTKDLTQANCHRLYKPEEINRINGNSYQNDLIKCSVSFNEILDHKHEKSNLLSVKVWFDFLDFHNFTAEGVDVGFLVF